MTYNADLVYSFLVTGKEDLIVGQFISQNEEWIVLRDIPVDYVIDGCRLLNKKWVENAFLGPDEEFIKKVVALKNLPVLEIKLHEINETGIFRELISSKKIVQIETDRDDITFIGKINSLMGRTIKVTLMEVNGEWAEDMRFNLAEVCSVQFDNDYTISLNLYNKAYL